MCNDACIDFGRTNLPAADVRGKRVIEVGSLDVNGSLRKLVERLEPGSYLGVDIAEGPGVDEVCDVLSLSARYGSDCFDIVVSTETLEHVREWRKAVSSMKGILRPGGILLLTTRSAGFPYHGYPHDFWRFELADMEVIFGDMLMDALQPDPTAPGVFVRARKPAAFTERDLAGYELFSIITRERCRDVRQADILLMKSKHRLRQIASAILPRTVKTFIKKLVPGVARW